MTPARSILQASINSTSLAFSVRVLSMSQTCRSTPFEPLSTWQGALPPVTVASARPRIGGLKKGDRITMIGSGDVRFSGRLLVSGCFLMAGGVGAFGQAPPAVLTIDLANFVEYYQDTADLSTLAANPSVTTAAIGNGKNFFAITILADIVSVNGQPVKGIYTSQNRVVSSSPTPAPGTGIADTVVTAFRDDIFKILDLNENPIGSIAAIGLSGGVPAPGGPTTLKGGDWVITGGTGAFLGVRGQMGGSGAQKGDRPASMTEDPANRRTNGGGTFEFVLYLLPNQVPQVATTNGVPAIVHSNDFSLVTAAKPAAPGEILSLFATGLGPVSPNVPPGQAFPGNPLASIASPIGVAVNGEPAEVIGAVGYPGSTGGYQVNFQLPQDVKGSATIQLSSAWIPGSPVTVPVQ
jgi:hypothetical protein